MARNPLVNWGLAAFGLKVGRVDESEPGHYTTNIRDTSHQHGTPLKQTTLRVHIPSLPRRCIHPHRNAGQGHITYCLCNTLVVRHRKRSCFVARRVHGLP
jgi:hypothetical protein